MTDILSFIPVFPLQTEEVVYERMVIWANEGLSPGDDRWVDTREGAMFWTMIRPGVREIARLYDVAGTEVVASGHPLLAWGEYLDDLAEVYGLARLASTAAEGVVRFTGTPATVISAGTRVTVAQVDPDADAPTFDVSAGGTIPAALATPGPVTATPSASGGTLAANTYYYVVTALSLIGETVASAQDDAVTTGTTSSVTVDWPDVAGAIGYRVYRGTNTGGPYLLLASPTLSTYLDTGTATAAPNPPVAGTSGGAVDLPVTATDAGTSGNVSIGAITALVTPVSGVTSITNLAATAGGTEPEDDAALRDRLQESFRPRGPGTVADYERWAKQEPGVGDATVIPIWNGPDSVLIVLTDPDGQPVSGATVTALQLRLDPIPGQGAGEAPIGHVVTVRTPTVVLIDVSATVEFDDGYDLDGVGGAVALRSQIEAAVRNYIDSIEAGGEVVKARVAARVAEHRGVHDVGNVLLNGGAVNITVTSDPSQVPRTDDITLTEGTL